MGFFGGPVDFLIHWPPGPVVATVQCQGLALPLVIAVIRVDLDLILGWLGWYYGSVTNTMTHGMLVMVMKTESEMYVIPSLTKLWGHSISNVT